VLSNLVRNGFAGEIHLINPKRAEIEGRPCLPSVAALPDNVDCAVLAIPRAAVLETIWSLAERGMGSAIIFSAGFAEGDEEGVAQQRARRSICARPWSSICRSWMTQTPLRCGRRCPSLSG
jgi:acyl-CoA synthetase (NDP forming)